MKIIPNSDIGRLVVAALIDKIATLPDGSDRDMLQAIVNEAHSNMDLVPEPPPQWVTRGKTITQLIQELGSFEDQTLEVRLTFDCGQTHKPISILTRRDGYAMIENSEW
jgi:hypothetical protein